VGHVSELVGLIVTQKSVFQANSDKSEDVSHESFNPGRAEYIRRCGL